MTHSIEHQGLDRGRTFPLYPFLSLQSTTMLRSQPALLLYWGSCTSDSWRQHDTYWTAWDMTLITRNYQQASQPETFLPYPLGCRVTRMAGLGECACCMVFEVPRGAEYREMIARIGNV